MTDRILDKPAVVSLLGEDGAAEIESLEFPEGLDLTTAGDDLAASQICKEREALETKERKD